MKAFECKMCGQCCYGEGISVDEEEIKRIARFMDMKEEEFKKRFCIRKQNKYELRTKESNYCIFLKEKDGNQICSIHPVKPDVCKRWPFVPALLSDKDEWKMIKEFCPGINPDACFEDFVNQAKNEI